MEGGDIWRAIWRGQAAERNYGQNEKEALALIFAVQKFHRMLYGLNFTLKIDHKPLFAISEVRKETKAL